MDRDQSAICHYSCLLLCVKPRFQLFLILISCTFQLEHFLFKMHILRFWREIQPINFLAVFINLHQDIAIIRGIKRTFAHSCGDKSPFSYSAFCLLPNLVYDCTEYWREVSSVIPSSFPCCQDKEASYESSGKRSRSRFPGAFNIPVNACVGGNLVGRNLCSKCGWGIW